MSFSLDLSKATKNITEHTEKVVRGTLLGVSSRIIKSTPVGNPDLWKDPPPPGYIGGTLRGAWNASVGTIDRTITNKIDSNGSQTINDVLSALNSLTIGETYYLTNPQPYAYRVEYGWSSQAPSGMVRTNVMAAQQELNKRL